MNPIIRAIGYLSLVWGGFLAYHVTLICFRPPVHIKTLTFILLPLIHLGTGLGLVLGKRLSRYFMVFTAVFYLFAGILISKSAISLADFIPLVEIIEMLPAGLLKMSPSLLSFLSFGALPFLVLALLSLKSVGFSLEPFLKGQHSWSIPIPIMAGAAFLFAYALIGASEVSLFMESRGRSFFGMTFPPSIEKGIAYVEFCVPFILAFALIEGERWSWFAAFVYVAYYWSPFLLEGFHLDQIKEVNFGLFGFGFMYLLLGLLLYRGFFWNQSQWLELRDQKKHWVLYGVLSFFTVVLLGFSFVLFSPDVSFSMPNIKPPVSQNQAPLPVVEQPAVWAPAFKLEGTSVDSGGSYAIVSGEVVYIGTVLSGYKVEAIHQNLVLFSKDGKQFSLDSEGHFKETA